MRIVGGAFRGTALAAVGRGDAAAHLRPTADRVRESLFNVLGGGRFEDPVSDAFVLDLFAGTGALGLEALSRGARQATFVDDGRAAQGLLRQNIARLGVKDRTRLLTRTALKLPDAELAHDLVFLDPPYGRDIGSAALTHATERGWIAPGALVVWEEASPQTPPAGFTSLETRRYGSTWITFLRADI